ncbi:MAG: hypothetical protein EA390_13790 [Balneolaceae bacterium]|nr:MAG: hypothetical protein EA390_13790 [Balneolaceae bacterium]
MTLPKSFIRVWQLSLISFIIAGITGFLYRYGMLYPLPDGISLANIRHAHSHLMFFNWICPPIMAWMAVAVTEKSDKATLRSFLPCIYTMIVLGFLSYPFFLLYGYHSVAIGPASLPLAAIISGLIMITWYWFAWLYYRERQISSQSLSLTLFDAALIALVISSLGAWGVSVFQFTTIDSPLISSAMTHFFLGVFTEGWVVLGVLGIMWAKFDLPKFSFHSGWLWIPLLFGSMLVFPFSLNRAIITPEMHITANIGLILIAISLSLHLFLMVKHKQVAGFIWKTVAAIITVKIIFQIMAVLPLDIWPGEHGLRVLYLHLLLLGLASIVLVQAIHLNRHKTAKVVFVIAVLLVLISLLFISGYWPPNLMVPDIYWWLMVAALLPLIPAVWLYVLTFQKNKL